jgi:simple sugar transport system substrate-binding protein
MVDQGIDVVTCHVDSPKVVVETAERRGAMVCGYHASQASLAPKGYLTGAEWNWEALYPKFVTMTMKGETIPNFYRGGYKEGLVKSSPYGAMVPEAARKQADAAKAAFMTGTFVIYKGGLKDNKGTTVIPAGAGLGQTDIKLESMGYLVEGVIGSTS